jgi:hypothetical protein
MVSHMKITVDIADPVLKEAKLIAAREGVTLRSLVEEGLRRVIEDRERQKTGFKLRDARFKGGGGGAPGVDPDDWMSIKHLVRGAGS